MGGDDSRLIGRLDDDRTGTIAEQYAGRSIGPVDQFCNDLRANNQCTFRFAGANEFICRC